MEFDTIKQPVHDSIAPLADPHSTNTTNTPHRKNQTLFIFGIAILLAGLFSIGSYELVLRKTLPFAQPAKKDLSIISTQNLTPPPPTLVTSITPLVNMTYTDASLGATFQYPSTLLVVDNDWMPGTKIGDSFGVTLQDRSVLHYSNNTLYVDSNDGIYLGFENNPHNYTLAQYYQHTFPGGMELYANVAFETVTNPNGIQFQRLIRPYKASDYSYSLEVMHKGKYYSINRTFRPPTSKSQDLYQRENAAFTQIVNSFKFTN